jgi:hypothetical protein
MKRTAQKNNHRFYPLQPKIYRNKSHFIWIGNFETTCAYFLDYPDDQDINKLCGISTNILPCINSIRIGWRYNKLTKRIDLGVLKQVKKLQTWQYVTSVNFDEDFMVELFLHADKTAQFIFNNRIHCSVNFNHKKWLFGCNPYFGGNIAAPHKMHINLHQLL